MNNAHQGFPKLLKLTAILTTVLAALTVSAGAGLAEYQPQGGNPPTGGSTTSGMVW